MAPSSPLRWTPERRPEVEGALRQSRTRAEAATRLHITVDSLDAACVTYGLKPHQLLGSGEPAVMAPPASPDLSIAELVEDRKRRFARRLRHETDRALIPVSVKTDKPIGILHFGDPHLDDDGCDVGTIERHARLVRETPGLYGATVGDMTNNWVGRLAKLYATQTTTAADGWRLAEWFVGEVRDWLYIVGGNHDAWSGAGDPMKWIASQLGAFYQDSEVRIALRIGSAPAVRVNCRHDFAGRSQYNPAHGPMKALFFGVRDHLAIAGHTHESAYGVLKDPDSHITMHAIRVASYKVYDRYARDKGFRDQHLGPACVTVIDPRLPPTHPDLIKPFWDPEEGAEFLTWTRSRRRAA